MDSQSAQNLSAAVGVTVQELGQELAGWVHCTLLHISAAQILREFVSRMFARSHRVLPNIISKPLSSSGLDSEFEAQMLDVELTLRRALSAGVSAAMSPTPSGPGAVSTGFAAATSSAPGPHLSEGQPDRKGTSPRTRPRAVARVVSKESKALKAMTSV